MLRYSFVSVLFNEPKLLKLFCKNVSFDRESKVSVLFNEPKLLKSNNPYDAVDDADVSVLFNEPKLLKYVEAIRTLQGRLMFQCSSTSRNC